MHAECSAVWRLHGSPSSLDGLDAGGLEAGELQLHAAFELVEQLLQQPVGETQKQQMEGSQRGSRES